MKLSSFTDWLVEPSFAKTGFFAASGYFSWAWIKGFMGGVVLVCTTVLFVIHVYNALNRQWCPVRRKKWKACTGCPFEATVFCWRGTNPDGKEEL